MLLTKKFETISGTRGELTMWELFHAIQHLRNASRYYAGTVVAPLIEQQLEEVKQLWNLVDATYNGGDSDDTGREETEHQDSHVQRGNNIDASGT